MQYNFINIMLLMLGVALHLAVVLASLTVLRLRRVSAKRQLEPVGALRLELASYTSAAARVLDAKASAIRAPVKTIWKATIPAAL